MRLLGVKNVTKNYRLNQNIDFSFNCYTKFLLKKLYSYLKMVFSLQKIID